MAADDEDVTDNIPVPVTKTTASAPKVTLETDAGAMEGLLQTADGDQITVVTQQTLPMDSQVQVKSSDGAVTGAGVVIWNRDAAGEGGIAVGLEILGGADEWAKLLS